MPTLRCLKHLTRHCLAMAYVAFQIEARLAFVMVGVTSESGKLPSEATV